MLLMSCLSQALADTPGDLAEVGGAASAGAACVQCLTSIGVSPDLVVPVTVLTVAAVQFGIRWLREWDKERQARLAKHVEVERILQEAANGEAEAKEVKASKAS
jgi:hypothetical protein